MALPLYDLINNINKQIKSICCKIEQGSGGGGSSTNIYNSDGILTGNRSVDCDNRNVSFDNYRAFSIRSANNTQKNTFNLFSTNFPAAFIELFTEDQSLNKIFGIKIENFPTFNIREIYVGDVSQNQNKLGTLTNIVNNTISTFYNNNNIGLKLDFANEVYEFGQLTGSNATKLKIDDAAAFPVQVSGTNVSQNTSGAASGKFLKIKVDGVDYVIELKNPS